jgi:hypothetical protein
MQARPAPAAATTPAAEPTGALPSPPPRPHWRGLWQPAALVGLATAACAYTYSIDPNGSSLFPQCPLHAATGLDCPFCGATRAAYALMHGDLMRAFDHNLLLLVMLPFAVYAFVRWAARRTGYLLPTLWQRWMGWGLVGLLAGFLVIRNLPLDPFTYLDARA